MVGFPAGFPVSSNLAVLTEVTKNSSSHWPFRLIQDISLDISETFPTAVKAVTVGRALLIPFLKITKNSFMANDLKFPSIYAIERNRK